MFIIVCINKEGYIFRESVDNIPWRDSFESQAALSCGAVLCSVQGG